MIPKILNTQTKSVSVATLILAAFYIASGLLGLLRDRLLFGKFGAVEDVALIKDRNTGLAKGFGFITFGSESAAQSSLSMNGQEINGRALKVSIAKDREEGQGGGGRDGGGFRDGGRDRR